MIHKIQSFKKHLNTDWALQCHQETGMNGGPCQFCSTLGVPQLVPKNIKNIVTKICIIFHFLQKAILKFLKQIPQYQSCHRYEESSISILRKLHKSVKCVIFYYKFKD